MNTMRSTSLSSAKKVAGIITYIMWEILLRLLLKSLFLLKLVLKRWWTLISGQRFCESHTFHDHPCPTSLIFSDRGGSHILSLTTPTPTPTLRVLNLDFLNQSAVTVIRSCNGFLLCKSDSAYFVGNPITRDFTTLTLCNHPFRNKNIDLYLVFDSFISSHYKVISITQLLNNWIFNEYSFKSGSWISPGISLSSQLFGNIQVYYGVYCNHAIHWCDYAEFSVYFDVDTQRLKKWPMPLSDREWENRVIRHFGECGGRLFLVVTLVNQSQKYDIFELKENYSGWSLRHQVDLNPLLQMYGYPYPYAWHLTIVGPVKEEKSMLVLLVVKGTLILYDPVTSTKLCEIQMGPVTRAPVFNSVGFRNKVFQYFENTALVEA